MCYFQQQKMLLLVSSADDQLIGNFRVTLRGESYCSGP